MCFLCIINWLHTVQYYILGCVSWVLRLTLLNLHTDWTNKYPFGMESVHTKGTSCIPLSSQAIGLLKVISSIFTLKRIALLQLSGEP